ncbi:MAG: SDR family NAD(P)-dependent oxidoreductase [Acidimicrobiales bacterium]
MPAPTPTYVPGHGLLAGKTVVVTAAAGTGIGSAVARKAIEEGATVLISDFHERRLGETADRLADETGHRPATQVCNVTVEDDVQALVAAAVEHLGGIDVMINNAGLGGSAPIVDMTDEQWSTVLDVTLTGTFRCTRAVLRHMVERGSGVIVNNASVLGWRAQAEQAHYAAAKAGVMAPTRCTAIEAAPRHPGQRRGAEPGHAPVPGQGHHRRPPRRAHRAQAFGRYAEPWRSPTSWSSWPATTPAT